MIESLYRNGGMHPYDNSSSRRTPIMPTHLGEHDQQGEALAHRYYPPHYYLASAQPSVSMGSAMTHTSFAPHQSWPTDSHPVGSDYGNSASVSPFSEYGPVDHGAHVPPQAVVYPESSQRTHAREAGYLALQTARFHEGAVATNNSHAAAIRSSGEGHAMSHSPDGHRALMAGHGYDGMPAATCATLDMFTDERRAFERLSSYRFDHSRAGLALQLGNLATTPLSPTSSYNSLTSPQSLAQPEATRITTRSPKFPPYVLQPARMSVYDRLGEPGSPSVVPPLVYDGEFGEEYDDESEYSLPSAGSEAAHSIDPAPGHSELQKVADTNMRDQWSHSTYNSSSPVKSPSTHAARSPTPSPLSEFISPGTTPEPVSSERTKSSKKSKMHQCVICSKWFPRPSGLATHMNSHSGAKPYKCPMNGCTKSFAVRSNAKRHLRTHGIFPSSDQTNPPAQFTVGFDEPIISEVHEVAKLPSKLRWVPQSLSTRTNINYLRDSSSDSDDDFPPSCPVVSVPLPPVMPSSKWNGDDRYEDRNSYEHVGPSPYLSNQWRALPGPAIVSPTYA